jgi:hypothetical protein
MSTIEEQSNQERKEVVKATVARQELDHLVIQVYIFEHKLFN